MFSYKHVHVFRQSFDNRPYASPESIPARHIVYLLLGGGWSKYGFAMPDDWYARVR